MFKMRKSVLIIDDDVSLCRQLSIHLNKRFGYTVRAAFSGEQGLVLAEKAAPQAILLDWMMPGMSGLAVLQTLKQTKDLRRIPVAMMTGRSTLGDVEKALALGCFDYFVKPLVLPALGRKLSVELDGETLPQGPFALVARHLGLVR